MRPRLDIGCGTAFAQTYDVINHLRLRLPDGSQKEFYNSAHSFGTDMPLSLTGSDNITSRQLDESRAAGFMIDFDLVAGEYHLVLEDEAYFREAKHRYEGWQSSTLAFTLRAVSLEMVCAST